MAVPVTNEKRVTLYHGSDVAIEHPDVTLNTGFADLGRGFYVTDDHDAARRRAATRARREGASAGVVSAFAFDESCLRWVTMAEQPVGDVAGIPFGLCFSEDACGLAAWMAYIKACRRGETALEGFGEPAVVRAWIATEEVELVCSGLASEEDVAPYLEPSELIVQYCFRDQAATDAFLAFVETETVAR